MKSNICLCLKAKKLIGSLAQQLYKVRDRLLASKYCVPIIMSMLSANP